MADMVSTTDEEHIERAADVRPARRNLLAMQDNRPLRVLGFIVVFA